MTKQDMRTPAEMTKHAPSFVIPGARPVLRHFERTCPDLLSFRAHAPSFVISSEGRKAVVEKSYFLRFSALGTGMGMGLCGFGAGLAAGISPLVALAAASAAHLA